MGCARAWIVATCLGAAGCSSSSQSGDAGSSADAADAAAADAAAPDAVAADAEAFPDALADPYSIQALDNARINSHSDLPNFQRAVADVDFHDGPFSFVLMTLDLSSTCFPFSNWTADPPPPGQNWPADCDAFDRNLEVTLDPATTSTDPPGLEVLRAITPFGGPLTVPVDITDLANGKPGRHGVSVVIPTYSDGAGQVSGSNGGWNVSLKFEVYPGDAPQKILAVQSLVNESRYSDTATTSVRFEVPPGTVDARIEYRVTGHGGGTPGANCIGPAEEFCRRTHTILVDGHGAGRLDAWRTNCDQLCTIAHSSGPGPRTYCMENPCGATQSVRAPRANWCPGSVTPPAIFTVPALLVPGPHEFEYQVDTILPGGVWRVSATFVAIGS